MVAVLCALSLVFVALAHRPLSAGPRAADPMMAEYLANGGLLADLCRAGGTGDGGMAQPDCPACTLAKGLALACAPQGVAAPLTFAALVAIWPDQPTRTDTRPRAPPVRAPPFIA